MEAKGFLISKTGAVTCLGKGAGQKEMKENDFCSTHTHLGEPNVP